MNNIDKAGQVIYDEVYQTWERGEILTAAGEAERLANALADAGLLAPDLAQENLRMREQIKGLILAMETKAANNEWQDPATIASYLKEIVLGDHDG
ncbi:hypothetical protein [Corynebacterium hiratae]|uniref:Uncharacterized protein n=1 Tax=Corynebacterium hiratae TaxID=3139423 RepID=A0A553FYU1_9CORY|nr:hypothetical protein [Corynebacterium aurimucosum]TRX62414.1 hypothetical protein FNY97_05435 [Corynebacterium aurimucosum]